MIKLDNDNLRLRNAVFKKVASLAYSGELSEENLEKIPYEIVPGNAAHFRCCVYKEREILRQRTRLATGKLPSGKEEDGSIITVIPAACEGCPINRYRVTENCQRCLAKSCQAACPFGAISMTGRGAYIEQDKCKECGRCAAACPYNAIADLIRPCKRSCPVNAIEIGDDKLAKIDLDKCIACGNCVTHCPFSAVSDRSFIVPVIEALKGDGYVAAVIAPALEGQFGENCTMGKLKNAVKALGFDEVIEVALGADATAEHEAKELAEVVGQGGKMTTSCCPAFVNMIEKHFPKLVPYMSTTVSPMTAVSRLIKEEHKEAKVVFIGPCIAKKTEVKRVEGADYVLTTEELIAMLQAREIDVASMEESEQDGSIFGKGFAEAGGVTGAVMRALEEMGVAPSIAAHRCNGALECKKALTMLGSGRFPSNFIEGMSCEGGCVNGPGNIQDVRVAKSARAKLLTKADDRDITVNTEEHGFGKVKMER